MNDCLPALSEGLQKKIEEYGAHSAEIERLMREVEQGGASGSESRPDA